MVEARAELNIPSDAFVFLAFGLIRPYKGLETLIRTFLTSFASPRCFLVIAGNPCSAEARTTIGRLTASSPYIRLKLGLVPNDQIETLFNACNVAVFPFCCTFTSSSIILACSLGRPVVIPLIGALPRAEKSGFFTYDPSHPHGLRQAMQESMSADWYEQGKRAKSLIVQRDWCEIGDRMVETYTSIVGGHRT
jgi:glycosyltransferase involved in cell wall biosynthesis